MTQTGTGSHARGSAALGAAIAVSSGDADQGPISTRRQGHRGAPGAVQASQQLSKSNISPGDTGYGLPCATLLFPRKSALAGETALLMLLSLLKEKSERNPTRHHVIKRKSGKPRCDRIYSVDPM